MLHSIQKSYIQMLILPPTIVNQECQNYLIGSVHHDHTTSLLLSDSSNQSDTPMHLQQILQNALIQKNYLSLVAVTWTTACLLTQIIVITTLMWKRLHIIALHAQVKLKLQDHHCFLFLCFRKCGMSIREG